VTQKATIAIILIVNVLCVYITDVSFIQL